MIAMPKRAHHMPALCRMGFKHTFRQRESASEAARTIIGIASEVAHFDESFHWLLRVVQLASSNTLSPMRPNSTRNEGIQQRAYLSTFNWHDGSLYPASSSAPGLFPGDNRVCRPSERFSV